MTELFAVTAATNSVKLNARREAEVAFTVSNTGRRPVRGRAHVLAEGNAERGWFSLAGDPEQTFAVAGTQQYTVKIDVPKDAPAGDYFFRLNMVGVENPDEDFTEGPSVAFVVPEPEVQKKPFPWWILLVILAVIVIGGVAFFLLSGGEPELAVAVDVSADPVIAGRDLTYTIALTNNGRQEATGVVMTDTLPTGTTFVSASSPDCQLGPAGQVLVCQLTEPVAGNSTTEVEVVVNVDGATRDSLVNSISVQAEGLEEPIQGQTASSVVSQVLLAAEMSGPANVTAAEEIHYQVTVGNSGPSHAREVVVTYPRPDGILGASATSSNGNCTEAEGALRCELGVVEAGAAVPVTITVVPGPDAVGTLTAQVAVNDGEGADLSSQEVVTQVDPATGLAVTVNASGGQALIGEDFIYTVSVWNNSPLPANNVELRYEIPDEWEYIATNPECPQQLFGGQTTLICNLGTLPADPNQIESVAITVRATAEGTIQNSFLVSSDDAPETQIAAETRVAKAFSSTGLAFDGLNDWVQLDDFAVPESFTVEMWLNPNVSRNGQAFIGKQGADGDIFWVGYWENGLQVNLRGQTYTAGENTTGLYHLAVVVEKRTLSQSFVTVYQNGQVFWDQELSAVLGEAVGGQGWVLGQRWTAGAPADFFDGKMTEVRLWDHARTQAQVNTLMDERLTGSEAGLLAYWPLVETTGTAITDQSGNGHDGEPMNGLIWVASNQPLIPPTPTPLPTPTPVPNVAPTLPVNLFGINIQSVNIAGQGQVATVSPGASVNTAVGFFIQDTGCPGCIDQILIGIANDDMGLNAAQGCVYNGLPGTAGVSGSGSVTFNAPTTPGTYYLRFRKGQDFSCKLGWWNVNFTPAANTNIGILVVN